MTAFCDAQQDQSFFDIADSNVEGANTNKNIKFEDEDDIDIKI